MSRYIELSSRDFDERRQSVVPYNEQRVIEEEGSLLSLDEALELNSIGFYHYRLLVLCGFAWMADAFELNLLSYLSSCAGIEWNLSEFAEASITGAAFGGVIIGSAFCGLIADWYGRRIGFLSATFLVSIGGLLTALSTSFPLLVMSRLIVGFGIGGGNIPFDLLAELLPMQQRGSFLVYINYFWTFGSAFVSLLAWIYLDDYGWRFLAFITMIPVAFTSFFSMYYLPESPRWLLTQNRIQEAENIIKYSMKCNGVTEIPNFRIKPLSGLPERQPTQPQNMQSHSRDGNHNNHSAWYQTILQIVKESVTLPLWVIWFSFGFGYYGLLLFISRLYSSNSSSQLSCSFDYSIIFYSSLAELVGVTLCIFLLDCFGRIKIQKIFYALTGIATFFMGCSFSNNYFLMIASMIGRMVIMISSVIYLGFLLFTLFSF